MTVRIGDVFVVLIAYIAGKIRANTSHPSMGFRADDMLPILLRILLRGWSNEFCIDGRGSAHRVVGGRRGLLWLFLQLRPWLIGPLCAVQRSAC